MNKLPVFNYGIEYYKCKPTIIAEAIKYCIPAFIIGVCVGIAVTLLWFVRITKC